MLRKKYRLQRIKYQLLIRYLTRKIFYALLVLAGVVCIVFFLFQGFGDPARLVLGQTGDSATIQNIRKELYLDQPKWKQFVYYVKDISPVSIHSVQEIEQKKLIAYFFAIVLGPYTGLNLTGSYFEYDDYTGEKYIVIKNLILPALTLGIRPLAIITQLTRSAMLDVLNQDYIRTAYAKGLSKRKVIFKHALRNALNPVLTAVTGWFAELLAGAFFVEYIFGWKGIGKITVDALDKLDFPVVMGSVLVTATLFVIINILSDVLYSIVDPRVKTG